MVSWIIATGVDDAAEDATEDASLDEVADDDGVLEATEAIDDAVLATLDDIAVAEDVLDVLDIVIVGLESLLPPQPLSTTAI